MSNKTSCPVSSATNTRGMKLLLAFVATVSMAGCHSAYMNATVSNHGQSAVSVVQVEYPSASFGTQTIAPGQDFKYRFKVLGTGLIKVTYTDSAQKEHKFSGPSLKEGDEGALSVVLGAAEPQWKLALATR